MYPRRVQARALTDICRPKQPPVREVVGTDKRSAVNVLLLCLIFVSYRFQAIQNVLFFPLNSFRELFPAFYFSNTCFNCSSAQTTLFRPCRFASYSMVSAIFR